MKIHFFCTQASIRGDLDYDPSPTNVVHTDFYGGLNITLARYNFVYPQPTGSDPELPDDPWSPGPEPEEPEPGDPGMPVLPGHGWPPTIFNPATSGLESLSLFPGVSVFPNPASGSFTITGLKESTDIRLYDLTGKLLLDASADLQLKVDVTWFAQGIYSLVLQQENRMETVCLIVK